jgi:putative DNA primase/helicase
MPERLKLIDQEPAFEQVPERLRSLPQWICWRAEPHPSRRKPMKTPYNPMTGEKANIHDPETWGNFAAVVESYRIHYYDGIGLVLTQDDGIVGIDLDGCITDGQLSTLAQEIVTLLDSYTEISPSGSGIRIFVTADLGDFAGRRGQGLELYNFNRYLSVTGDHLPGTPLDVCSRYQELRSLYRKYLHAPATTPTHTAPEGMPATLEQSDEVVLSRLFAGKLGELYRQIYHGVTTEVYGAGQGESDQSRADVLLFNGLAFYTYQDAVQMRRILLSSPRYSQRAHKWHKRVQGETTYLDYQIADSIRYTRSQR